MKNLRAFINPLALTLSNRKRLSGERPDHPSNRKRPGRERRPGPSHRQRSSRERLDGPSLGARELFP
jgi:hypothetical protein